MSQQRVGKASSEQFRQPESPIALRAACEAMDALERAIQQLPSVASSGAVMDQLLQLRESIIGCYVKVNHPQPPAQATVAGSAAAPPSSSAGSAPAPAGAPVDIFPNTPPGDCTGLAARRYQQVLQILRGLKVLPVTVAVPMRILDLQRSRSAGVGDFADAIAADPALCCRILSMANSAWYAPPRPITTVQKAISTIGMRNLLPLVFSLSMAGTFSQIRIPVTEKDALWRAAILKAAASREYCLQNAPQFAEEAFICGILQDIALPIFYAADNSVWPQVLNVVELGPADRAERERSLFGVDHVELGRLLALQLGLPRLFQAAIASHHDPMSPDAATPEAHLLNGSRLAGVLPHRLAGGQAVCAKPLRERLFPRSGDAPAIDAQAIAGVLEATCPAYREIVGTLMGERDSNAEFTLFLQEMAAEVTRSVEQAISDSQAQINDLRARETTLREDMRELEVQAQASEFDTLTHLLNRRGLLLGMEKVFAATRKFNNECGIAFIDLDCFKGINDQYGHAAGDAALAAVAEVLREISRGRGIVARLGGDEFVFVVVAKRQEVGAQIIEQLQAALGVKTVTCGSDTIKMTASIGLCWLATPPADQKPEQALHEADKLMYDAKRAGKARMMVGRPQDPTADPLAA